MSAAPMDNIFRVEAIEQAAMGAISVGDRLVGDIDTLGIFIGRLARDPTHKWMLLSGQYRILSIGNATTEEIEAANDFRNRMIDRADDKIRLMWHGWVIMDAFTAGIQWERKRAK